MKRQLEGKSVHNLKQLSMVIRKIWRGLPTFLMLKVIILYTSQLRPCSLLVYSFKNN